MFVELSLCLETGFPLAAIAHAGGERSLFGLHSGRCDQYGARRFDRWRMVVVWLDLLSRFLPQQSGLSLRLVDGTDSGFQYTKEAYTFY